MPVASDTQPIQSSNGVVPYDVWLIPTFVRTNVISNALINGMLMCQSLVLL